TTARRSRTNGLRPCFARYAAQTRPLCPPPMMIASTLSGIMTPGGSQRRSIMPAIISGLSFRRVVACLAIGIGVAALVGATSVRRPFGKGWGGYSEPAPAGPEEARTRQLLLSTQPREERFAGLFEYFAAGFVRHAVPGYARVQYAGAGSR